MPSKTPPAPLIARWLPLAGGLFAFGGGIASIIGWIAGIPRLLSWSANDIQIKFNTALCITAVGSALIISSLAPQQKLGIRIFGSVAIVVAGLTFIEHITGLNFGLDTLFVDEPPGAAATTAPGRMGLPASVSLTMLGAALILASIKSACRPAAILAVISLCISSLSLTGYLFGANQLFSLPRTTGIALQSASMIAATSVGIIALAREHGIAATLLRADAGGSMFRRLIIPIVLISLSLGWIRLVLQSGGYVDTAFGTAARTVVEIVLLLGILWWTAESLSRSEARSREAMNFRSENETLRRIAVAQEAERRRIARDVHDHIGQSLTALRLKLDALRQRMISEGTDSVEISQTAEHAKKLDADVSLLVWQMRPGVLDTHGLASALNSFVREWSTNYGIDVEFHTTSPETRLSPEIETNLYRIIQEALNNVLKHANASNVSITINFLAEEAVLVIEDNGAGFDTDADQIHTTEGSGYGLIGMKERAALVGGKLEIESNPGGGTAILVRVPRKKNAKAFAAHLGDPPTRKSVQRSDRS